MTDRAKRPVRRASVGITLVISNGIKLVGVYVFLSELKRNPRSEVVLGYAAFMMTGAQLSEDFLMRLIDRFLGGQTPGEELEEH